MKDQSRVFEEKYDVASLLEDGKLRMLLSNPEFINDLLAMVDGESEDIKELIKKLHSTAKET